MLWEGSLIMVDSETGSLWSHILGQAMRGPLVGTKLEQIPSVMTDWGEWKETHPKTTLVMMQRVSNSYVRTMHDPDGGLLIGLPTREGAKSWSFAELHDNPPVNDTVGGVPVVVSLGRESFAATIFDRRIDDKTLTFDLVDDKIVDKETDSVWNLISGRAESGELEGQQLKQLPGIVSDSAVWSLYYESALPQDSEASGPESELSE
jgi:hypothetical protein